MNRNFVAKHMNNFNRPSTMMCRKTEMKMNPAKLNNKTINDLTECDESDSMYDYDDESYADNDYDSDYDNHILLNKLKGKDYD